MGEVVVSSEGGGMEMELQLQETEVGVQAEDLETGRRDGSGEAEAASSSAVRWERFLPKMVLRVLLVEADDCTRQIVAALLRKCNYRVAAVSDGLKAWEVIKARPQNIDLILTEIDLPSISGYALLTLIMEHEICKNVPVIMMSSHDSVSTVYKCMLKGAADFLVKPVRKNELRNLWQHVWRRQASSSGGVGPQNESVGRQKVEATAENNAINNPSTSYTDCIRQNREGIEKGSDAQSSCAKPGMDVEGVDSDLNINETRLFMEESPMDNYDSWGSHEVTATDIYAMTRGDHTEEKLQHDHALTSSREAINLIGAFDNYLKTRDVSSGSPTRMDKADSSPLLDLSLRRSHPSVSVNQIADEKHRLNHSDASAFSRYVNRASTPRQTSPVSFNQQKDNETDSDKHLANETTDYNSDARFATPSSHEHTCFNIGQLDRAEAPERAEFSFPCPPHRVLPVRVPVIGLRSDDLSNAYSSIGLSLLQSPGSSGHHESSFQLNQFHPSNGPIRCSDEFNNYSRNANDTTDQTENKQVHDFGRSEDQGPCSATGQSATSNFCNGIASHLRGIGYGSNGNIVAVQFVDSASEEASPFHEGTNRSAQREAALTKFRLKRKERCYEKKVRYESRKKLAEQRPRVKGQFVRQAHKEPYPGNS